MIYSICLHLVYTNSLYMLNYHMRKCSWWRSLSDYQKVELWVYFHYTNSPWAHWTATSICWQQHQMHVLVDVCDADSALCVCCFSLRIVCLCCLILKFHIKMFLLPPAAVVRGSIVLLQIVNKISHAFLQIWQQCQLGPQKNELFGVWWSGVLLNKLFVTILEFKNISQASNKIVNIKKLKGRPYI